MTIYDDHCGGLVPAGSDTDRPCAPFVPLALEPADYAVHLDGYALSPEQQHALLSALWHIMSAMVDIGFGVDGVQYLLPELFQKASQDSGKLVIEGDRPEHHAGQIDRSLRKG